MAPPLLFVALDDLVDHEADTLRLAARLAKVEGEFCFKVNLDFFLLSRMNLQEIVRGFKQLKRPLFADLKMLNGSRTMLSAGKRFIDLGVEYINVYALAEREMTSLLDYARGTGTTVLVLTVLSHFDEAYCLRNFRRPLLSTVQYLIASSLQYGATHFIVPGTMLEATREYKAAKVATGIRPGWYRDDRHAQEVTPAQAAKARAFGLVCGSPITKNTGREEDALRWILEEISTAAS